RSLRPVLPERPHVAGVRVRGRPRPPRTEVAPCPAPVRGPRRPRPRVRGSSLPRGRPRGRRRRPRDGDPVLEVRHLAAVRADPGEGHRPMAQPWPWRTWRIDVAVCSRPDVTVSVFPGTIATRNDFG